MTDVIVNISKGLAKELVMPIMHMSIEDANKELAKLKLNYRVGKVQEGIDGSSRVLLVTPNEVKDYE